MVVVVGVVVVGVVVVGVVVVGVVVVGIAEIGLVVGFPAVIVDLMLNDSSWKKMNEYELKTK